MKSAFYLLFLTMIALSGEAGHTATTDGPRQENTKTSDQQSDHAQTSEKHQPRHANSTKTDHVQRPTRYEHSARRDAGNTHQIASNPPMLASKGKTVEPIRPIQPRPVARPVASPNNVRHRSPNPASVGGTAISASKNTGAINGSRIARKP